MKIAAIFPGQGSQKPGMGKDFYDAYVRAREVFDEADDILGKKFSKLIFEGDAQTLSLTHNSQLAIFITSVAMFEVLKEQLPEIKFSAMGGLSLGEYTALYASGRLSFADALRLVAKRGELMQEAAEMEAGTMAAIIGMDSEQIKPFLEQGVWIANLNCPGQVVISGKVAQVEAVMNKSKESGARRAIRLEVSGAFHSGLMESARVRLAPAIESVPLSSSDVQLVMNVPGDFVNSESELRTHLIAQVVESTRWEDCIRALMRDGVTRFIEIGPSRTLASMNRSIGAGQTHSIEKVEHLDALLTEVNQ